jgi:hypothetical protein
MVEQLTPEQIAAILNQNASRPAVQQASSVPVEKPSALAPSQNDIPKMISEEPFTFSSPDAAIRSQPAPLTPFSAPTENPLNLLSSSPVEAPSDLLSQRRVDIVAGPFSIGSFTPPPAPPISPPPTAVPAQIPIVQSAPVAKKVKRKRKAKPNESQINVSRSK